MTVNSTAAASVTMGQSTKGNPIVKVGQIIFNRACASDMLAVVDDPAALSVFRGLLVELVGLQTIAVAEKASKAADKIEKETPPPAQPVVPVITPPALPVVVTPAPPSMSTAETLASIQASLDTVKQDRKSMRGAPVPQRLPVANVPSATIQVAATPVSEAEERAALIAEGKSLGMPAVSAYGLKMDIVKLRDKVSAARKPVSPAPAKPTAPAVPTKPVRTLLADFVNQMPDGREVYTAVYSDGSTHVEVTGTARKVA